jgi:arylsulfatase A-like enzyme
MPSSRLRLAAGLGACVALAETVAALALHATEPAFLLLQAGVILVVGLGLAGAPWSRRWIVGLPAAAVGGMHLGRLFVMSGWELEPVHWLALAAHAALTLYVLRRLVGDALFELRRAEGWPPLLAAAVVQSSACALLLVPLTHADLGGKVALGLFAATALPLLAAWAVRAAMHPHATIRRRAWAAAPVALMVALFAAHEPFTWRSHEQMGPGGFPLQPRGVDVLWIVLDTVRADRMSVYGHARPTTPHLERFAAGATRYERAVSQGVWTLPGHASMFTGLYPSEHEADWLRRGMNAGKLRDEAITAAERFRMAGWRTGCVAGNSFLFGRGFGLTQGFELAWCEPGLASQLPVPYAVSHAVHTLRGQSARQRIGALERNQYAPAREINRLGLELFERLGTDRPRFVFLNYMEAHGLLRREPCPAPVFGAGRPFGEWDVPDVERVMAGELQADPAALEKLRDWYDTQLACLDHHLGELFDELRARGLFEELLIVVTSDHGHMLGEHRAFKHKAEVWEGLVGVPLLIKLPGQTRGTLCGEVVETADLALAVPALAGVPLELAVPPWAGTPGFEPPQLWRPEATGRAHEASFQGVVPPCPLPGRAGEAAAEAARQGELAEKYPQRWDRAHLAFRVGDLKLVQDSLGERYACDLALDPLETPRAPTDEEHALLTTLVEAWRAGLVPQPEGRGAAVAVDAARRLEALRKQGYIGE